MFLVPVVPVVLVALVLRHALQFAGKVAQPIAAVLPVSHVGGVALASIIAVMVLLGGMPQYRMVKSLDLSMRDAMQLVKRLGIGSAAKLRDTNLAASTPS